MKIVIAAVSISLLGPLTIAMDSLPKTSNTQSLVVHSNTDISFNRGSYEIVKIKYDHSVQLSEKELRRILQKVGFNGNGLEMAVAIAHYESTFRPAALNKSSNCYGLFQINMTGNLGESRREKYGLSENEDLFNPLINAKIAYQMSNGGKNWSAWSTEKAAKRMAND